MAEHGTVPSCSTTRAAGAEDAVRGGTDAGAGADAGAKEAGFITLRDAARAGRPDALFALCAMFVPGWTNATLLGVKRLGGGKSGAAVHMVRVRLGPPPPRVSRAAEADDADTKHGVAVEEEGEDLVAAVVKQTVDADDEIGLHAHRAWSHLHCIPTLYFPSRSGSGRGRGGDRGSGDERANHSCAAAAAPADPPAAADDDQLVHGLCIYEHIAGHEMRRTAGVEHLFDRQLAVAFGRAVAALHTADSTWYDTAAAACLRSSSSSAAAATKTTTTTTTSAAVATAAVSPTQALLRGKSALFAASPAGREMARLAPACGGFEAACIFALVSEAAAEFPALAGVPALVVECAKLLDPTSLMGRVVVGHGDLHVGNIIHPERRRRRRHHRRCDGRSGRCSGHSCQSDGDGDNGGVGDSNGSDDNDNFDDGSNDDEDDDDHSCPLFLIDFDRCMRLPAACDLGYSLAHAPTRRYPPVAMRRAAARAYVDALSPATVAAFTRCSVDDVLFDVQKACTLRWCYGLAEVHVLLDGCTMDAKRRWVAAVVEHVEEAVDLLTRAEAEQEAGREAAAAPAAAAPPEREGAVAGQRDPQSDRRQQQQKKKTTTAATPSLYTQVLETGLERLTGGMAAAYGVAGTDTTHKRAMAGATPKPLLGAAGLSRRRPAGNAQPAASTRQCV